MMKIPKDYFIALSHKNFNETFVIRKHRLKKFIKANKTLWEKYDIDTKDFVIGAVILKDLEIENFLNETQPEIFL